MKMYLKLVLISGTAATFCLSAQAQDMRSASEQVVACQSITDPAEKLACFETAASALSKLLQTPAPSVVSDAAPSPEIAPVPLEMAEASVTAETPKAEAPIQTAEADVPDEFGKRRLLPSWVPTVSLNIGGKDQEKEPDFFETTVTRIQRNKIGRHFFTTADGQVWKQFQIKEVRAPKSLPAKAVIRQTISGSIRLEIEENGRSYPVVRVE